MTAALEESSWDLGPEDGGPRRPSLEDVGGATLEDDTKHAPDKSKMPYAAQLNQLQKQASAQGQVADSLILSVEITSGAPAVVGFATPRTGLTLASFTPTDNGTGDTTITWPADTFPPELAAPQVSINQDIGELVGATIVSVTNGVRVRTRRASGDVDLHFTITRH